MKNVVLDAKALKQNHKGFIETDEEQKVIEISFNSKV